MSHGVPILLIGTLLHTQVFQFNEKAFPVTASVGSKVCLSLLYVLRGNTYAVTVSLNPCVQSWVNNSTC